MQLDPPTTDPIPASLLKRRLSLLGRLHDAQDDHIATRRATSEGVTAAGLEADNERWVELGVAVAALARLIRAHCIASEYCGARPTLETLAARLSEAVDDQIDGPSWAVVDAAARLDAARPA